MSSPPFPCSDHWNDYQRLTAERLRATHYGGAHVIRVVTPDAHGQARSKSFTAEAFSSVLAGGTGFSSTNLVADTGGALAVDFEKPDAGIGLPVLRGAGNYLAVPDPCTFLVLPWTSPPHGWVIADCYLPDGRPHPLSSRRVLRDQVERAAVHGYQMLVGLEVEWSLLEGDGRSPVDRSVSLNLDSRTDALSSVLDPLISTLQRLKLPLRTVEHESGPGQIEMTFSPLDALAAADAMVLIRSATTQLCARLGYKATFMSLPAGAGMNINGWHLHQSLVALGDNNQNLFSPQSGTLLPPLAMAYLGGLLAHADVLTALASPTVNGYRRLNSKFAFAPDRVGWGHDVRGAAFRVVDGHLESRIGEPLANPYLHIASQLAAGLDGIEQDLDPGSPLDDPHDVSAPALPVDLEVAIDAVQNSSFARQLLGGPFAELWVRMKRQELQSSRTDKTYDLHSTSPTAWEHREYLELV